MLAREMKIPQNFSNISKEGIDFINKVHCDLSKMIQRDVRKRLGYNGIQ
jgi:hypothetical protein